jgi:tetratricopeptide (TPR) repeat protein
VSILGRFFHRDGMAEYRRGIVLFNQGRYEDAVAAFERNLKAIDDKSDPYYSLGRFYAAEAHAKLGMALHRSGSLDRAEVQFRAALACGYRYPDLHVLLAAILEERGDLVGSERECRAALDIHPGYLDARCRLLVALIRQGKTAEAGEEAARLTSSGCALPEIGDLGQTGFDAGMIEKLRTSIDDRQKGQPHLTRALESYDRGNREEAIAELRSAVDAHPGYADLRCRLGSLLIEDGLPEEALEELERAIQINPNYVEARLQAGVACLRLGDPGGAARHLRIAHERQPDYPDVQLFLGLALLRDGETAESGRILESALSAAPGFERARYVLGLVRLVEGRVREAIGMIEEAAAADPLGTRGSVDLGFLHVRHGDPEVAASLFRQVIASDPADAEARLGLGLALEAVGDDVAARDELQESLRFSPEGLPAITAIARIDLRAGKPESALPGIEVALEHTPRDPDLLCLKGQALARMGEAARSKEAYEQALALHPAHTQARVGLALSLFRLERKDAGRAEMEAAFRADPANPIARVFADDGLIAGL